jgi:hypothetical protein
LIVSAHVEVGVEVEDADGALRAGGIQSRKRGESDFVTTTEADDELRFFEGGGGESGKFSLGKFELFIVARHVTQVVEGKGLVDGEVRQGLAELLGALLGTNAALVAEYTFVTGESEKVDSTGIGGWTDFDNVVPPVAVCSV